MVGWPINENVVLFSFTHISSSQPESRQRLGSEGDTNSPLDPVDRQFWFSQPVHPDHMLLSSQIQGTPGSSQVRHILYQPLNLVMIRIVYLGINFNSFQNFPVVQYKPAFKYVFHIDLVLFYLKFQICTLYELLKILSDFYLFFIQNPWQKLVRRMTRFFVKPDKDETKEELEKVFDLLGYRWKFNSPGMVCCKKSKDCTIFRRYFVRNAICIN